MNDRLRSTLERAIGVAIVRVAPVRGGDVAVAYALTLADGRRVFAKTHPGAPKEFFTTEAASLTWLHEADALPVPRVVAVSDDKPNHLVLDWIEEGAGRSGTEAELGAGLARLHQAGAPSFGRADRRTTGSRGLPNEPAATWSEFYANSRLLPLARLARAARVLRDDVIDALERLADDLDRFDPHHEPPSRLHGDLWAGNRVIDRAGASWLIDPAAHGGHREFDLAMMRLFGGFGPDCFAAYADAHWLAPGWEDRVELHQIAPLVVHAIKFQGHYVDAATRAIRRYAY